MLLNRLPLRSDVRRLPIFGLGCAGGVLGLARAADLARAAPRSRVLFLVVELCALCFRHGDFTKSNLVATALFGDGATAAVISCEGQGPTLGHSGEFTWPQSLDIMGWDVADDGLKAIFSRDIPALVQRDLRTTTDDFLRRHDLSVSDIDYFVCHPGGAKVLDALEEAFEMAPGALGHARATLRDYGNMSAATVLFVLKRMLEAGVHGRMLMTALGPGFTAGFQLIEV
jgi:alkylresorcinol/alkylpyrone synthase